MKLIKKNYKFILGILIGVLLFGSGVYAGTLINSNEVTFTPKNNKWNVTKVDEALNSLYSVAVPEEYSGTTSVTPTYSDITLNTQDKLVKNNITISGIPSTYKNLTNTTTGTSADLATGKTLYNSDGSLITGTGSIGGTNCITGTYTITSDCTTSTGCTLFEGMKPTIYYDKIINSSSNIILINRYDKNEDPDNFYQYKSNASRLKYAFSNYFKIENNKFMIKGSGSSLLNQDLKYVACE